MTTAEAPPAPIEPDADDELGGPEVFGPDDMGDGPVQQPADLVDDDEIENAGQMAVFEGAGALAIDPRQKKLNPEQTAALVAIGIDVEGDPQVTPHVRPFMHLCQVRGLDPWAREVYLIGRGQGSNRKYTMQTGIDGYAKLGGATGRFLRIGKIAWTGKGDDMAQDWRQDADGDMERVFWTFWPETRGEPGGARVVLHHLDAALGEPVTTTMVANWEMYAPYGEVWEGRGATRRKVLNDDGSPRLKLTGVWENGGPYMLAKCATALAFRRAFPAKTSGLYVNEELHRADFDERRRLGMDDAASERRLIAVRDQLPKRDLPSLERMLSSTSRPLAPGHIEGEIVTGTGAAVTAAAAGAEEVEQAAAEHAAAEIKGTRPEGDEQQQAAWLRAELTFIADLVNQTPDALARFAVKEHKRNLKEFTRDQLLALVPTLRPMALVRMRDEDDVAAADAYEQVGDDVAAPLWWLRGEPRPAAADDE